MTRENFIQFARDATCSIGHRTQRMAARRELIDHLEERYAGLRADGASEAEAEVGALRAMGDARNMAKGLEKANRPRLTWRIVVILVLIGLGCFVAFYLAYVIPLLHMYL